jgi:hypothetical protein
MPDAADWIDALDVAAVAAACAEALQGQLGRATSGDRTSGPQTPRRQRAAAGEAS